MNGCLLVPVITLDASHQTQTTGTTNDSFCIIYTWLCSVVRLRLSTMRSTLGVFSCDFEVFFWRLHITFSVPSSTWPVLDPPTVCGHGCFSLLWFDGTSTSTSYVTAVLLFYSKTSRHWPTHPTNRLFRWCQNCSPGHWFRYCTFIGQHTLPALPSRVLVDTWHLTCKFIEMRDVTGTSSDQGR